MPDLSLEQEDGGLVCGVDEVGRGPLAGPVVAAAVVLDLDHLPKSLKRGIDDSKLMTAEAREACFAALRRCALIGLGAASVREIDTINILRASLLAMRRAVAALGIRPDLALVDGNQRPDLRCPVRTVIGGDGRSLSVAAASIVAKVTRDLAMRRLAGRYPGYGWEHNAGYATPDHRRAIHERGITIHHRRSFGCVRMQLELDFEMPVEVTEIVNH
jgi:ribonuclease HII